MNQTFKAYDKAKEIARYLPGFKAVPSKYDGQMNERFASIVGERDEEFTLSVITYGSKLGFIDISGDYPRGPDGEYLADSYVNGEKLAPPRISVNGNRPGEALAKDIGRRFLPEYRAVLAKVVELKEAREKYNYNVAQQVKELRAVYGGDMHRDNNGFSLPFKNLRAYGSVDYVSDGTANIKISSLSIGVMKKVLQVLADADKAAKGKS